MIICKKLFLLLAFVSVCEISTAGTPKDRLDQLQYIEQSSDTSISFYGKVKDQYGQQVSDAKVKAGLEYFSATAFYFLGVGTLDANTDANGCFKFKELTGKHFYIQSIEKNGYEYKPSTNPNRSFRKRACFH